MARRQTIIILGLAALMAGCTSEAPRQAEQPVVSAGQPTTSIPSAILGEAPPPEGEAVTYLPGDSLTQGYLAVPDGEGPFPALILIHEWNGLVDRVRQVADAFAEQGYVALAADLYQGRTGTNRDENMALVNETRGAGLHEVVWNGRDDSGRGVSSGTYFYRVEAGPYSDVKKMTLMK